MKVPKWIIFMRAVFLFFIVIFILLMFLLHRMLNQIQRVLESK